MIRPTLASATDAVQRLPHLPASTRQLLGYLNDESVDLKIILRTIECDQGLAVGVLRIANSPYYGMPNQVQTIRDAIVLLGFSNLRMIIVATMASSINFPNLQDAEKVRNLFRHGLAVAVCASFVARKNGLDAGLLFLTGILHDIGILALMATYPELHQDARQLASRDAIQLHEAERAVFGFDHAEIGASLCRHWNLPAAIVQAIGFHHQIAEVDDLKQPMDKAIMAAGVIHVADAIAHGLNLEKASQVTVPHFANQIWSQLIGNQDAMTAKFPEIETLYQELVALIA
jgi:putative nucleotidyltransferase with HDIG domain